MLEKNLQVLKKKDPDLAEEIKNEVKEDLKYKVEAAKNDSKTIKVIKNNDSTYLHSKYNPEKEAKRFVAGISNLNEADSIVIVGFGLGHHILELFREIKNKRVNLFIIEESLFLFKEALKHKDFTEVLSYEKCKLFIGKSKSEMEDKVYLFIRENLNDQIFEDIKVVKWAPSVKLNEEYYNIILTEIRDIFSALLTNQKMMVEVGKDWNANLLKNLKHIVTTPSYNCLNNFFNGKPIIIVSAGPSLNKNIEELKKIKGKAVIISVSTALKALLAKGIIPDIVILIDQSEKMLAHFEGIDYSQLTDVVLAFSGKVQPKIINDWPGLKILTSIPHKDYLILLRWIEQYTEYKDRVFAGGSVAHSAFGLAFYLGGDPIVFVGQDLAFSNGNTHVNGSPAKETIEENMAKHKKDSYLKVEDINGDMIWTRQDYYKYLKWFNRNIETLYRNGDYVEFIDATEGGAKIEGTKIMKLKEVIDEYCGEEINIQKKIKEGINNWQLSFDKQMIVDLKKSVNNMKEIKYLSESGLDLIDELVEDSFTHEGKFEKINKKLSQINEEIGKLKEDLLFFEAEFYDMYSNRAVKSTNDYLEQGETEGEINKINKLVDFYNRLIRGSKKTIKILEASLEDLKEIKEA